MLNNYVKNKNNQLAAQKKKNDGSGTMKSSKTRKLNTFQ
jgi:hypothetical protein